MLFRRFSIFAALILSFSASADFEYKGSGKLLYPTGVETELDFGFTAKKIDYGYTFTAGNQKMEVSSVPEKYSIWFSMDPSEGIYVQEFSRNYFTEFELQLGEHKLALKKKVLKPKRALGDYVLTIDNIDYFFKGNQGSIDILFNEDGISSIDATGFVKDIGMSE